MASRGSPFLSNLKKLSPMPDSPLPDPNQALSAYQADVAAYGMLKASWWRLSFLAAFEVGIWQYKMIGRLCGALGRSKMAPEQMSIALLETCARLATTRLNSMPDYLDRCRMQVRRRGDA